MSILEESERVTGNYGSMAMSQTSSFIQKGSSTESSSSRSGLDFQPNYLVDEAIEQCKRFLVPYYIGIKILGWTQLTKENRWPLQVVRWSFVFFWNFVLVGTFTVQAISCYSRDRFINNVIMNTTNDTTKREISCSENVVFISIFYDILILLTYWFGLILFSHNEKDSVFNLAEKMFIKLTASQDPSNTKPVIRTIWAFIIVGLLWILFSITIRVMIAVTVRQYESNAVITSGSITLDHALKDALVTLSLVGCITYDVVYFMAITNYVVQCEMIFYFIRSVREFVKQKQYPSIDASIKDIYDIREKLCKLNGKTSVTAAMAIFNMASNAIFALDSLDDLRTTKHSDLNNKYLAVVTAVLNVVLWVVPVIFPFIQAARVTGQCDKLKQTGFYLRTRPYQYSKTSLLELDSYSVFTQAAKLRATMCGIPIYPWVLYLTLIIITLLTVIVFQSDSFDIARFVT